MAKYTPVTEALHEYMLTHRTQDDPLLEELRRETREKFGRASGMQIAAEQGTFLAMLVSLMGAKRVLEVGTFTGYSSLCMARALPPDGLLIACDVSGEFTAMARCYWEKAGVADRIELRLGPAVETLSAMPPEPVFDLAFVDADKPSYPVYYEQILERLRPGGLLAIDNVFWSGQVVRPEDQSESTVALRETNDRIADDERVQSVMLAVSDGLTLVRKLG